MNQVHALIKALVADPATDLVTAGASPAQFDASKNLATMEAVQRALGNMSGNVQVAGPTGSLTAADAGKRAVCLATTLNLPASGQLPLGATFHVSFAADATTTITPAAGDTIYSGDLLVGAATATVPNGSHGLIVKVAANTWVMTGSSALQYERQFGRLFSAAGYQKFPGGLIVQWGGVPSIAANSSQTVTYATPFPTGVFALLPGSGYTAAGGPVMNGQAISNTQAKFWNTSTSAATGIGSYLAIGY